MRQSRPLFIFILFKRALYRKNGRFKRHSNLDRWNIRREKWPLRHHHHHGPSFKDVLFLTKEIPGKFSVQTPRQFFWSLLLWRLSKDVFQLPLIVFIEQRGDLLLIKWAIPGLFFRFFILSSKHYNFYNKCENVHLVNGAGIRSHDLWNISLIP